MNIDTIITQFVNNNGQFTTDDVVEVIIAAGIDTSRVTVDRILFRLFTVKFIRRLEDGNAVWENIFRSV